MRISTGMMVSRSLIVRHLKRLETVFAGNSESLLGMVYKGVNCEGFRIEDCIGFISLGNSLSSLAVP